MAHRLHIMQKTNLALHKIQLSLTRRLAIDILASALRKQSTLPLTLIPLNRLHLPINLILSQQLQQNPRTILHFPQSTPVILHQVHALVIYS